MGSEDAPPSRSVRIGPVQFQVADDQPTFWDRVEANQWEPGTLALMKACVDARTEFIDMGAWVGPLTLYAASLGAQVMAVEADPRALDQLERNLAANPGLVSRVQIIPRAVSAGSEPVRMGARRKSGDSMSSTLLSGSPSSWLAEPVTPTELAGMMGGQGARFVKIDIEGGEYALLPALGPLLGGDNVALLLALHPDILRETGVSDVASLMARLLVPFTGWDISQITFSGPVPSSLAEMIASAAVPGEWLMSTRPLREDN